MKSDIQDGVCNHCSNCVIFFMQPAKADIRTCAHCAWLLHPSHSLEDELFSGKYHKTNNMKGPTIHTGRFYRTFHTIVKIKTNTLTCTKVNNSHLLTFSNQLLNVISVSTAMLYMTWWEEGRREDTSIRSCSLTKELPVIKWKHVCCVFSHLSPSLLRVPPYFIYDNQWKVQLCTLLQVPSGRTVTAKT